METARLCRDILLRDGHKAIIAAREHICTPAFENVVEANILLSGIGFENAGCAGAHSFSAGMSAVRQCADLLHGEKVAFGVLCQLVLENQSVNEIEIVWDLFVAAGLPVSFEDLGIEKGEETDTVRAIARKSMSGAFWDHEPFPVEEDDICHAMIETDRLSMWFKQKYNCRENRL